jgi:hypothetical protein
MDKGSRHGGQVLNARNPSAMSPTNTQLRPNLGNEDFGLKVSIWPLLEECLGNISRLPQRFTYKSKRHTQMVCLFDSDLLVPS